MNKSESKYFNTAIKMDKAFLALLEEKDFEYITVKELCKRADVNRSTFYLHYENMTDLLAESFEYMYDDFLSYFKIKVANFLESIGKCPIEDLVLVSSKYLTPYLNYIKKNKKLFQTAMKRTATLNLEHSYQRMFEHIFNPILERFRFPVPERKYVTTFYIHGIIAIITEWLKNDCVDEIKDVENIIIKCTKPLGGNDEIGNLFREE